MLIFLCIQYYTLTSSKFATYTAMEYYIDNIFLFAVEAFQADLEDNVQDKVDKIQADYNTTRDLQVKT